MAESLDKTLESLRDLSESIKKAAADIVDMTDATYGVPNEIRGEFVTVRCTCCAGEISLNKEMPAGFCPVCGSKVSLEQAKKREFDKSLTEQLSGDEYYAIAGTDIDGNFIPEHAEAAAKKGSLLAALDAGKYYASEEEHKKALQMFSLAANKGSPDGVFGVAMSKYSAGMLHTSDDFRSCISDLKRAAKKGFSYFSADAVSDVIDAMEAALKDVVAAENYKPSLNLSSFYSGTSSYSSSSSSSSDGAGAFGYPEELGPNYHPNLSNTESYPPDTESYPPDPETFPSSSDLW